jgi:hypothetical protein
MSKCVINIKISNSQKSALNHTQNGIKGAYIYTTL